MQPFPSIDETVAPDPTDLWGPYVRRAPYPTNTPWLNFVLNKGTCPEYIHPFLVQAQDGHLSICYPTRAVQPGFIFQVFVANLTLHLQEGCGCHAVSHYDDLSVTLDFGGLLTVPLVRGSPYITVICNGGTPFFSTIHAVLDLWSNAEETKYRITMNNGQVWLVYSSGPLHLSTELQVESAFRGVLRITVITEGEASESILDRFSTCYAVGGIADFSVPFQIKYRWKKQGWGDLLMLSLPLHREILSNPLERISGLTFNSMDGALEGLVGHIWVLQERPISVGWYSSKVIEDPAARAQVAEALEWDVSQLSTIGTASTYFFGKAVARAARLALIAEELSLPRIVGKVHEFLVSSITPWFDGTFAGNALLYDRKWGGVISRDGSRDAGADFGLGIYNDHHYHMGYFVYAGAVLAKLDPGWGRAYRQHLYAVVADYMNVDPTNKLFPRLRNFDAFVLHSWAGGLTEFADGRNQESTSEAVHAYYAASLLGLAFGDASLINVGLTLAALEARAAQALWHVPVCSAVYERTFVAENRVVSVLWSSKRDSGLWFAAADRRDCRLGIQLLPLTPFSAVLFSDATFARELVDWTMPTLQRDDVTDGWRGFVYALQALYAPDQALALVVRLSSHDDGNSLSNLLWWIHTR